MALKFFDEKPKSSRTGGGSRIMTDTVVAELEANPGKWGLVAEGVTNAQSVAKWVASQNLDSTSKTWEYTSRNTGKTVKNRNNKQVPTFDVFVCFKP